MKKIFQLTIVFLTITNLSILQAQETNSTENLSIKVMGSCGMCKKTIEKTAISAGATNANWDESSKMLQLSFNNLKTNIKDIQKAIVVLGYDTQDYKASDASYNDLSECCKYDRDEIKKASLNTNFLNLYYEIKNALAEDSAKEAAKKAILLSDEFNKNVDENLITSDANQYKTLIASLKYQTNIIANQLDINKQRDAFQTISNDFLSWVKLTDVKEKIFQQYCPMKKAFWLSNDKEIKNPYYGKQMLNCGSIQTEIN